jgi:hypothetical protein
VTTLLQMRRLVRTRLGVPVHDNMMRPELIDDCVNLAIQEIEEQHRWPWQETVQDPAPTVTTDEPYFDVPEGWRATVTLLRDTTELQQFSYADLMRYPSSATGAPTVYALIGDRIHVRPYPQAETTLIHIYIGTPTLLTADTDEPEIPAGYTGAIVAKACELLAIREDNRAAAATHAATFAQWMGNMRKDNRRTTGPITPRIRPGNWVE